MKVYAMILLVIQEGRPLPVTMTESGCWVNQPVRLDVSQGEVIRIFHRNLATNISFLILLCRDLGVGFFDEVKDLSTFVCHDYIWKLLLLMQCSQL